MSMKLVEYTQTHAAKKRAKEQKCTADAQALLRSLSAWTEVESMVDENPPSTAEIREVLKEIKSKTEDYCGGLVFLTAALSISAFLGLVTTHYAVSLICAALAYAVARKAVDYANMQGAVICALEILDGRNPQKVLTPPSSVKYRQM